MRSAISTVSAAIRAAETKAVPGSTAVTEAVARNLFKLMAIKDEYEVAQAVSPTALSSGSLTRSFRTTAGSSSILLRRSLAGMEPMGSRANRASVPG